MRGARKSLLMAAAVAALCFAGAAPTLAQPAPIPPPRVEGPPPPPPGPNYVWQPGQWRWFRHGYVWMPGQYVIRRAHWRHFAHGHWMRRHGEWVWAPGRWD